MSQRGLTDEEKEEGMKAMVAELVILGKLQVPGKHFVSAFLFTCPDSG
jgi:hypothetical protein